MWWDIMIARRKVDRIDISIPDQQNYFRIWESGTYCYTLVLSTSS